VGTTPEVLRRVFDRFAAGTSERAGSPSAFATAVCVRWCGRSGPRFGFSNIWQLIINTGTTIVTFLMVFLLRHTQNKDARALHTKMGVLIAATEASNRMLDVENLHLSRSSRRSASGSSAGRRRARASVTRSRTGSLREVPRRTERRRPAERPPPNFGQRPRQCAPARHPGRMSRVIADGP
jgi:low affinity Fe/Cu permease